MTGARHSEHRFRVYAGKKSPGGFRGSVMGMAAGSFAVVCLKAEFENIDDGGSNG